MSEKFQPYLGLDSSPDETPEFSLRISHELMSVDFYELSEKELREFVQDILDQLELYLRVNKKLQSSCQKVSEK